MSKTRIKFDATAAAEALAKFLNRYFLALLLVAYLGAALFPGPGQLMRQLTLGEVAVAGDQITVSLPFAMLAFLLLNAGLGTPTAELRTTTRRPWVIVAGFLANLAVPMVFILLVAGCLHWWPEVEEAQTILVGLALVAAMPIAGSSTAWTQKCDGDLALSLGLVLLSTFLSPWTTPLVLRFVSFLTVGDYSDDLGELAETGAEAFLIVGVLVPSAAGIGIRHMLGDSRMKTAKPFLRVANGLVLLALIYSNASLSLPDVVARPDGDYLAIIGVAVVALCVAAFASGWWLAQGLKLNDRQASSLVFGLGMNNNGTGLVLASMSLAEHPEAMLPIIFYNLVQHLAAGGADFVLARRHRKKTATNSWGVMAAQSADRVDGR